MQSKILLLLAGAGAWCTASPAAAQCMLGPSGYETETSGGQAIVRGTSKCPNGAPKTAYYAPSGVVSLDGSQFLLYVQGDNDVCAPSAPFDQVFLLKHPATWTGLTSAFDLSTAIQILPGTTQDVNSFYGGPSVFVDAGTYYMTASKSCGAVDFNTILIGCSTDGTNWTWRPLFTTPLGTNVPGATLRYSSIGGDNYWWGFIELAPPQTPPGGLGCGDCLKNPPCNTNYSGLGAIRVHLTNHSMSSCAAPTWDRVDILSGGTWKSVSPGQQINFIPDYISFHDIEPKLFYTGSGWELWTASVCDPNTHCPCDSGKPTNYAAGFHYQPVAVGATTLAPTPTELYSQIRCLPAGYSASRWTPFRVEFTNLLYSATYDIGCATASSGAYVVVTGLTP